MENIFTGILENEQEDQLIPFLQSLSKEEKKKLARFIKATKKQTWEYEGRSYTEKQLRIYSIATFVCMDLRMYCQVMYAPTYWAGGFIPYDNKEEPHLIGNRILDSILEWYCPDWLSDFLNDKRKNEEFLAARYEDMLRWEEKGYIKMSPELIAESLSNAYYEMSYSEKKKSVEFRYAPEKFLEHPITLLEHIWYLFQYPSSLTTQFMGLPEECNVQNLLIDFANEGHIDRNRLMKACLQTVNYSFNKKYIRWFANLFCKLQPTQEELLSLQPDLFLILQQGEDKLLSDSLECVKNICTEAGFRTDLFIKQIPALLASPVKAIVSCTFDIIEKIGFSNPVELETICMYLCTVFLHKDEKLQKKALRFLQTHGETSILAPVLSEYAESFHPVVRPAIENWLGKIEAKAVNTPMNEKIPTSPIRLIREINRIPEIRTLDDFIYFTASVFEPGEPWRCFMLPEYISRFQEEVTAETLSLFEPVIRNAYNICSDFYTNKASILNQQYYSFLVSWLKQQVKKHKNAPERIKTILKESIISNSKKGISELLLNHFLLTTVTDSLKNGQPVELLSTPTHSPIWIDPLELVNRIKKYQKRGEIPSTADMQLAMLRCARDVTDEAAELAGKELEGELKDLLLFLFGKKDKSPETPEHPVWWTTAKQIRDPQPTYTWKINVKTHFAFEPFETLLFDFPKQSVPAIDENTPVEEFIQSRNPEGYRAGDIYRMMLSTPYSHNKLLGETLEYGGSFKSVDSNPKARFTQVLHALSELYVPFTLMDYQFLAFCIMNPDRQIRDLAAGIWAKLADKPIFDATLFGQELARLVATEWLPFKRFTDIISQNMWNIGPEHDRQLEVCITSLVESLEKPVKGVKQLLDSWYELLVKEPQPLSDTVKKHLENWKTEMPGIKKQIDRINSLP